MGKRIGTDDVQTGQDKTVEISTTGKAEVISAAPEPDIDVVSESRMLSRADQEAFMNELVTIYVELDDDPNAAIFIPVGHQGDPQYIQRGVDQTVRRRFLYSLVAGKRKQLACSFGRNSEGKEFNRLEPTSRTTYRLHVVEDANPYGRRWFNAVMREA